MNIIKKVYRKYKNHLKHSVIPLPYSHQVKMNIPIKKGEQSGTALIPCTIYAMDHSIDMNPSLIRKKDNKTIKYFDPDKFRFVQDNSIDTYEVTKKVVRYNPNNFVLELSEDEKLQGYHLSELDRCKKCGQKLVVAEVKQTRYRSCPSVNVKLGDKSKEDLIVPVEFGFNKSDVMACWWLYPIMIGMCAIFTASIFGYNPVVFDLSDSAVQGMLAKIIPVAILKTLTYIVIGLVLATIWLYLIPKMIYKGYRILSWYYKIKPFVSKSPYKKTYKKLIPGPAL